MANSQNQRRTKATSANDWKKASSQLPLLETPTGKHIRMKRPGMTKFLEAGFLPDSLASAVRKEIAASGKRGARKASDKELMDKLLADADEDAMLDMLASMDRIVAYVIVEPPFAWHRRPVREDPSDPASPVRLDAQGREVLEDIPDSERRDDVVYTDEIDQEDKNFVFQAAVGGSTDLARFRARQAAVMDSLSAGAGLEEAPERAPAPQP